MPKPKFYSPGVTGRPMILHTPRTSSCFCYNKLFIWDQPWCHVITTARDMRLVVLIIITLYRKWQDYVYIQCEYKSTKQKIKHLLREENKVKENNIYMYLVSIIIINFKKTLTGHSWNWDCRDLKYPKLELELKSPELELKLKLIVCSGIGIGIENNGIGIGIELKK